MRSGSLVERVRAELGPDGELSASRVAAAARTAGIVLGDAGLRELVDELRSRELGAGPLDPLLADPDVTDVLVNGTSGVWVDRGRGVERVRVELGGEAEVRELGRRFAAAAGRRLDDAVPFVDARLPGGVRVHVVLPPLVEGGAHISLRQPARRPFDLDELVRRQSVPPAWRELLEQVVVRRLAFVVSGGTGAGKTTVLGTLLALVPPTERVLLVEDSAELVVDHPHVVRLEGRAANVEGRGAVTTADLVRQALRMRPDRLVVGEVRGPEVRDLLAALNTGHEGGCGTVHSNAATEVPARFEALGAQAGLDRAAVHAQLAGAIQVVLHLRRDGGRRRLVQVGVVRPPARDGLVEVHPALDADPTDPQAPGRRGPGWPLLRERCGLS